MKLKNKHWCCVSKLTGVCRDYFSRNSRCPRTSGVQETLGVRRLQGLWCQKSSCDQELSVSKDFRCLGSISIQELQVSRNSLYPRILGVYELSVFKDFRCPGTLSIQRLKMFRNYQCLMTSGFQEQ